MGIYGTGLGRWLQVGGALSRGPQSDRMQLPRDGIRRERWSRDEAGLFRWTAMPRRRVELKGFDVPERASGGSPA